jgi:hypothetical protein
MLAASLLLALSAAPALAESITFHTTIIRNGDQTYITTRGTNGYSSTSNSITSGNTTTTTRSYSAPDYIPPSQRYDGGMRGYRPLGR